MSLKKRRAIASLLAFVLFQTTIQGATYFVATDGVDTNPGTREFPLRTIQQGARKAVAGDVVVVAPGNYMEYVQTAASGAEGKPITFRAEGRAQARALRVSHPFNTFEGFTLTGAQNIWGAHVRVEAGGHHAVIRNCTIGPGVFVLADDFKIDDITDSVSSESVDFLSAGFAPGGQVFLGGSSFEPYWFKNHNTAWTVESVSKHSLTITGDFASETNSAAWAPIHAGMNRDGIEGVKFIVSGGMGASNSLIANCLFTNLFGPAITLKGNNHQIANNTFTKLNSYYGLRPHGSGHTIISNFWYNCTNIIHYSARELGEIPHPAGPEWYDYQVGFFHSVPPPGNADVNILFAHNWIENVHNQLGQIGEGPNHSGFYFKSNVFVGVQANLSGGRNRLVFENNTFYRVSYDETRSRALTIGGNSSTAPATNLSILRNVFVDIGDHSQTNNEGFYGLVNSVESTNDYNFAANAETLGFQGYREFRESNGVNGGDPLFVDVQNPRGPDGLPFTADDGLRPMPNSPLVRLAAGALDPVMQSPEEPIAHFRVMAPLGWQDKTGFEYNPAWFNAAPFARTNRLRPWDTPENLGLGPVKATFSAADSSAAPGGDHGAGIEKFIWDFGDGNRLESDQPMATHTFQSAGEFKVRLTVINSSGKQDSVEKRYRVTGTLAPPARFRILTKE